MIERQLNSTSRPLPFAMRDTDDLPITGSSGDITVSLRKPAGVFVVGAGTVTEIGGGLYEYTWNSGDTDTLGNLLVRMELTGAVTVEGVVQIVSHDPLTTIAAAAADSGSNIVNIFAIDQDSEPLFGTTIEARVSGTNSFITRHTVNTTSGSATFNLDDGSYAFYAYNPGVATFDNPYFLAVSGDQDATIQGTRLLAVSNPINGFVRLYAFISDLGLEPQAGVEMFIEPSGSSPISVDDEVLVVDHPLCASTDENGYVEIDVITGDNFEGGLVVKIPKARFKRFLDPPASGTINVATLL